MKNLFKILTLCIISFFIIISCNNEKQTEMETQSEVLEKKPLNISVDMLTTHLDLVCGMDLNEHTIADTAIYNNQLYGFCSEYCKTKFKEDPEKYIAKLDESN
jgi:YHS domain-containing protein